MNKPATRQGDNTDDPKSSTGPALSGSGDVAINTLPALRLGDGGTCDGHAWVAVEGITSILINGRPLCDVGSETSHPMGPGALVEGSANVLVAPGSSKSRKPSVRAAHKLKSSALDPSRIKEVIRDPRMLLSFALRDAATYLGHYLGFKVLGRYWPKVFGAFTKAWKVLRKVPFFSRIIASLESIASNFFDTLAFWLTGDLIGFYDAPPGDFDCPGQVPVANARILLQGPPPGPGEQADPASDYRGYYDVPSGGDITWQIESLLDELAPTICYFEDDSPSITIATVLAHGHWTVDGALYFDFDDETHEPGYFGGQRSGPYLRAWKLDNRMFVVGVGLLRAMSYWGCPHPTSPLVFGHEGDGEQPYLVFQVDEVMASPNADGARIGAVRPVWIVAAAHGFKRTYGWDKMVMHNGRLRLTIARGSHATSIVEGRQSARPGWFPVSTDYQAGPNTEGCRSDHDHVIADPEEVILLYGPEQSIINDGLDFSRSWSRLVDRLASEMTKTDTVAYWGKEKGLPPADPSPVWKFHFTTEPEVDEAKKHLLPIRNSTCPTEGCPISAACQLDGFKIDAEPPSDLQDLLSYAKYLEAEIQADPNDRLVSLRDKFIY